MFDLSAEEHAPARRGTDAGGGLESHGCAGGEDEGDDCDPEEPHGDLLGNEADLRGVCPQAASQPEAAVAIKTNNEMPNELRVLGAPAECAL